MIFYSHYLGIMLYLDLYTNVFSSEFTLKSCMDLDSQLITNSCNANVIAFVHRTDMHTDR